MSSEIRLIRNQTDDIQELTVGFKDTPNKTIKIGQQGTKPSPYPVTSRNEGTKTTVVDTLQ